MADILPFRPKPQPAKPLTGGTKPPTGQLGEPMPYGDFRRDLEPHDPLPPQGTSQNNYRQYLRKMGYPEEVVQKMCPEWPPKRKDLKLFEPGSTAYAASLDYEARYCSNRRMS